jgi:hypothetical protein
VVGVNTNTEQEVLNQAAQALLRLFGLMNSQVPTEKGSIESVALSTVRKYIGLGLFDGRGLTLREVDIVFSGVGVKQVSIYGVAYVLVRCLGRCRSTDLCSLVSTLATLLDQFVDKHQKDAAPLSKQALMEPAVELNQASTTDLIALRRLLERQTTPLTAMFNAYKGSAGSAQLEGDVISVDGAQSFALDFGLVPVVLSRSQFLVILQRSMVTDVDEDAGGTEEVTFDQFKRLVINIALCAPTFASGIDPGRMTATILVSNFLLWMRRKSSSWHRKLCLRASSRGAVNVPVLSFNMNPIIESSTHSKEEDEGERKRLLASLCGAQQAVKRAFV